MLLCFVDVLRGAQLMSSPARNQPPGLCRQFALKWALGVVAEIEEDSQIGTKVRMRMAMVWGEEICSTLLDGGFIAEGC